MNLNHPSNSLEAYNFLYLVNHPDYIKWAVQTMKFLIVELSPLPIRTTQ